MKQEYPSPYRTNSNNEFNFIGPYKNIWTMQKNSMYEQIFTTHGFVYYLAKIEIRIKNLFMLMNVSGK